MAALDPFDISRLAPPERVRCRKCKVWFDSADGYHNHLIRSGAHCACHCCFAEFASPKTLDEHLRQYHPAEQDITCKCGQHFTRAAGLIAHLDANECTGMSSRELGIRRLQAHFRNDALRAGATENGGHGAAVNNTSSAIPTAPSVSHPPMSAPSLPVSALPVSPLPVSSLPISALRLSVTPATTAIPTASVATAEDSDEDDLLYFEYPVKNGLPPDNLWSTEANYPPPYIELKPKRGKAKGRVSSGNAADLLTSDVEDMGESIYSAAPAVSIPALQPKILPLVSVPATTTISIADSVAASASAKTSDIWAQAVGSVSAKSTVPGPEEWSKDKIMEQIAIQQELASERDKKNPFHPSCPDFNLNEHWNPVLHVYKCPHLRCGKTKPHSENFIQHLMSQAHQSDEITCVVCLRVYNSPVAYTQHFESQGKKCRAREVGSNVISMATGGIINITGKNRDKTPKYAATFDENDRNAKTTTAAQIAFANQQEMAASKKRRDEAVKRQMERDQW